MYFMARAKNQLYSIPTYDAIFKLVLDQDDIRQSFFHAFIQRSPNEKWLQKKDRHVKIIP